MLNKRISLNKSVSEMSDRAQLLYTWTIAHLDKNGVIHGEPAVLRSIVIPRRTDVTIENVSDCIAEWSAAELVIWYEYDGDKWIEFPKFADNQVGLRADREPDTGNPTFAGCLPEDCRILAAENENKVRQTSANTATNDENKGRSKLREVKVNQVNTREQERVKNEIQVSGLGSQVIKAFQRHTPIWSDQSGNVDAIPRLVALATVRGDPDKVLPAMMHLYEELRGCRVPNMSENNKKFWSRQPMTPKGMLQIWDRLVPEAEAFMSKAQHDAEFQEDLDRVFA